MPTSGCLQAETIIAMKYNSLKRIVFLTFCLLISMAGWALEKESFNVDNIGYKSFSKEKRIGTEIYRAQKEIELAIVKGQVKQAPASLIAKRVAKAKVPKRKAIAAANDLIGAYDWAYFTSNSKDVDPAAVESSAGSAYVTIAAGEEENTVLINGMFTNPLTATVNLEEQTITIAGGQEAGSSSYGDYALYGMFYHEGDAENEANWYNCDIKAYIQDNGSVAFADDIWIVRQLTNGDYTGYSLTPYFMPNSVMTPREPLIPVIVPDGVEKVEYNMSYYESSTVEELSYKSVIVVVDGDDVYFQGLSEYLPESWIKGVKEGNTITFAANQYLGEDGSNGSSVMPYGNDAVFTYNPDEDTYALDGEFFGVLADSYYDGHYFNPVLTRVVEKAATPAQPTISGIEKTNDIDVIHFNVPAIDVDGEKLSASKLSYQFFYKEGDVEAAVVFTPADFTRITEDMTEIPFGFTENYDFSSNRIYLNMEHSTWSFIGIQSIYLGGDVENKSEIFWYDLKSAIIEFADANVKASCIPLTIDAEVYIYNVGTGKFISKGEAWGTQAIVSENPMLYQVQHPAGLDDGVYVLYSDETGKSNKFMVRCNSDGQMGSGNRGMFVDLALGNAAHVAIEEVAGGYYTIKPAADAPEEMDPNWCYGVNTAHASNQAKDGVTWGVWYDCTRADDGDNCLWAFISPSIYRAAVLKQALDQAAALGINVSEEQAVYDDRDNKTTDELVAAFKSVQNKIDLAKADGDNPYNFAELFLADPSFNATNKTGWTSTFTMQCNMTFKSFANDSESSLIGTVSKGGEYNSFPFMEFWNSTSGIGTKAVGKVYFVADELPAGIYKFSMMAYVNNLNEDNATNPTQFVYFGDRKYPLTKNGMHAYGEFFELTEPMTNVEIGFAQTEYQNCNWFGIDEIQLSYFANDLNAYRIEARKLLPEGWEDWETDYYGQFARPYFDALYDAADAIDAAKTGEAAKAAYLQTLEAVEAFNKNIQLVTKLQDDWPTLETMHNNLGESRAGDPSVDPCDALIETATAWLEAIDSDDTNGMLAVTNEALEQWFIDWEREFKECTYYSTIITFTDTKVKALCVANWDTDGDGELSKDEAAAVTDLETVFKYNITITSFDELQYFTGLTSIGNSAFSYCSGLTSITIPNSVTSIGDGAFNGCGLVSIHVEAGNTQYDSRDNCNAIIETESNTLIAGCKNTTIPNSVTGIGDRAFSHCSGLTSIEIPTSVTSIGDHAFYDCKGLTSIEIPTSVTSIGVHAFCNCVGLTSIEIPTSVTSIGYVAFSHCSGLTSIEIPISVTSIEDETFSFCSGLTSITIPTSVTSIGFDVFSGCTGLTSIHVESENTEYDSRDNCNALIETSSNTLITGCKNSTIPHSVTSIGDNAFYYCKELTSIEIPTSVTSIGVHACCNCVGLTSIEIPTSVTSIGYGAFSHCSGLTSIEIPTSVSHIEDETFENCSGLTSVTIPNSVTSIGYGAFCDCSGLTSIEIPNSVTSIGEQAFIECSGLTSVTIPNSVTSIGDYAFCYCSGLTSVKIEREEPVAINNATFTNCANATLYVPKGSKAAYEAADYWKEFKVIKEYPNGDVNQDGEVDVVDVVDIARFVVGTPSESFEVFLADLNNDKDVNIADAVVLVNEIAGDVNFARAMAPSSIDTEESLILTQQEDNSLSLVLTNEREYTAFQFDLFVPADTDVEQMLLNTQRKQRHQLLYNKVEEGHYRVTALSTSNRTFKGNGGELLSIMLNEVTSDIAVRNILFIDAMGNSYLFDDIGQSEGGTTGISLTPSPSPTGEGSIYDLLGRKIGQRSEFRIQNSELKKGLYIVNGKKIMINN